MERPLVFISYSWDSDTHNQWVLRLANDLMSKHGINVLLDQYELNVGNDLTYFLESSIEKADKVLLILTPNYKLKAEGRKGGVGYEYSMISQELFEIQPNNNKFIPILRLGDQSSASPKYISTKIYHSMVDDGKYLSQLYELSGIIYGRPKLIKPTLGPVPDFDNPDYDPVLELASELTSKGQINSDLDSILDSKEGVMLANSEVDKLFELIQRKATFYSERTSFKFRLQVQHRETLILSCLGYSAIIHWKCRYNNTTQDSLLKVSYHKGPINLSNGSLMFPSGKPNIKSSYQCSFDLTPDRSNVWTLSDRSFKSTDEIVKGAFAYIMEQIKEDKSPGFRIG
jgi:hypothetical protein